MEFQRKQTVPVWIRLLLLLGVMVIECGCATTQFVRLREKPVNPLTSRLKMSRLGHLRPSDRTESFLVASRYQGPDRLEEMLHHAQSQCVGPHAREALHALAELNYLGAEAVASKDAPLSSELYLDAAHAAWYYFSEPDDHGEHPNPVSDLHRGTAEVYNASCEALLRVAHRQGRKNLMASLQMPLTRRQLLAEIPDPTPLVNAEQVGEYEFVTDYELTNLRNRHVSRGLGVPVIAVRKPSKVAQPIEDYYTQGMSFAATVVFRFPEGLPPGGQSRQLPVQVQVFDPREADGIFVRNSTLPLEKDLSTPLAKFLSNPDLKLLDTWGFVRPDRARSVEGLYMVQPYDPDRIPVLMVHGVWSSPMTWMEMFNDLQADPDIGRRYQFWFYLYPTGEPLAFAAANLRDELDRVRDDCDPHRRNERLDEMIVVGHSMGGLISQMLTIDSEDRLWNSVSQIPVDQIQANSDEKNEIRRVFFFQSNPSVDRIVTIASPYHGSKYSNAFTRWATGSIVWLPSKTMQLSRLVFEQNNEVHWWDRVLYPRTSLDSLTKKSAVLTLIRDTNVPPDVKHHNIVGVDRGKTDRDWSDGVVRYSSAHLEGVASEVVVPASHSEIHRHPQAIDEMRRILKEHLADVSLKRRIQVTPVNQQAAPVLVP